MTIKTTSKFEKDFAALPEIIKKRAERQLAFFLENPNYPSLQTKKMIGHLNIWEGRISSSYRFTFNVIEECYILRRIGTHDILKTP